MNDLVVNILTKYPNIDSIFYNHNCCELVLLLVLLGKRSHLKDIDLFCFCLISSNSPGHVSFTMARQSPKVDWVPNQAFPT